MYHLSSSIICAVFAVSVFGLANPDLSATPDFTQPVATSVSASVNRSAKGDRLPVLLPISTGSVAKDIPNPKFTDRDRRSQTPTPSSIENIPKLQVPDEMPVGCEPAVSTASDNILARIPSRCLSSLPGSSSFAMSFETIRIVL